VLCRDIVVIIQDPETSLFPSIPRSALNQVPSAHVLPLPQIPALLLQLIREARPL
jgi:chemotaxis response regulator CheB